ncbi:MAG: glycosyltransferase family 4 protein [Clostridia bacterium]|nr:glycosyltransferase family 4 protein [Clostridia bacterium]
MKIVMVIDLVDLKTNGSVMTALRFVNGLKERGHEVITVAIGADGENDCPVDEKYVPLVTEVSAKNQIKFGKFDRDKIKKTFEGADIVHFIFPFNLEKKCKKLADEMGIPNTAAFHVQPENFSYNMHLGHFKPVVDFIYFFFRTYFYKNFQRVHCPSQVIANALKKHKYKAELYVISNGYDKSFIPPVTRTENEKFEIVMVGRLSPEKNQQVIINAIAKSKHKDNVHLTLLGNGPKKKKLEKSAKKLGVDISFDFLGRDELIKKLQASDLYIHSAKVETEAIACIEAIACGLVPVISDSKLSATPQFAIDERSLFKNNNAPSLAEKIDYWYENKDERLKMSGLYAEEAKKYSLENSIIKAEKMFQDQINATKN